ncbi:pyridoxal phosphate-dependent aminotransferase [Streptomyces sp. NPDC001985]|uniref:pyridoxal phosphate-dependent aminotransferase n=1 Tax=Streptomyces sp. NPDC001985 TaxID=3154406 RepID=UPI00331928DA
MTSDSGPGAGDRLRPLAIPESCLHGVFRAAEERERTTGRKTIRLHVGEPDFAPPDTVREALVAAVRDGRTAYTSAEGLLELREALTAKLREENGLRTSPDRVFLTPGSCQGLSAVFQTLAAPGAEILLPELHWPIHLQQIMLAGFRPVFYPLRHDFTPDVDALAALTGPRTRAVLVNSPANPTGAVMDEAAVRQLVELAHRSGWFLISDEAYEHFVYRGRHLSPASLEAGLAEPERRVFSTFSFSKSYAMTGYRLGYVVTPNATTARALRTTQEANIVSPATPVQYAGLAALAARTATEENRRAVAHAVDTALPPLIEAGLLTRPPAGGWYAVLDVERTGLEAEVLAAKLLHECDVAVAPARGFALRPVMARDSTVTGVDELPSARHLLRLALCGPPEELVSGVRSLLDLVAGQR